MATYTLNNLITNGSFETSGGSAPSLSNWNRWGGDPPTYTGLKFGKFMAYTDNTTSLKMATMTLPAPILNHKYYGCIWIKYNAGAGATISKINDDRFEYFGGDGAGKNWVFAYLTSYANAPLNEWFKASAIVSIDSITGSGWQLRCFIIL
ncbi:hypothetical protein FACS18949_12110 [Clostridia bacterium]|nr:hypothetical protein FACS18949_12110 [Clostridia bacterium]